MNIYEFFFESYVNVNELETIIELLFSPGRI